MFSFSSPDALTKERDEARAGLERERKSRERIEAQLNLVNSELASMEQQAMDIEQKSLVDREHVESLQRQNEDLRALVPNAGRSLVGGCLLFVAAVYFLLHPGATSPFESTRFDNAGGLLVQVGDWATLERGSAGLEPCNVTTALLKAKAQVDELRVENAELTANAAKGKAACPKAASSSSPSDDSKVALKECQAASEVLAAEYLAQEDALRTTSALFEQAHAEITLLTTELVAERARAKGLEVELQTQSVSSRLERSSKVAMKSTDKELQDVGVLLQDALLSNKALNEVNKGLVNTNKIQAEEHVAVAAELARTHTALQAAEADIKALRKRLSPFGSESTTSSWTAAFGGGGGSDGEGEADSDDIKMLRTQLAKARSHEAELEGVHQQLRNETWTLRKQLAEKADANGMLTTELGTCHEMLTRAGGGVSDSALPKFQECLASSALVREENLNLRLKNSDLEHLSGICRDSLKAVQKEGAWNVTSCAMKAEAAEKFTADVEARFTSEVAALEQRESKLTKSLGEAKDMYKEKSAELVLAKAAADRREVELQDKIGDLQEKLAATEKARTELLTEYTDFRVEELTIVADLEQQVDTATAELEAVAAARKELQREFAEATTLAEKRYKELQQHRDIFSTSTDVQHNLAHEAGAEADGLKRQVSALTQKLVAAEAGWEALRKEHDELQKEHAKHTTAAEKRKLEMEATMLSLESEYTAEKDSLEEHKKIGQSTKVLVAHLKSELTQAAEQLDYTKARLREAKRDAATAKTTMGVEVTELRGKVREYETQRSDADHDIEKAIRRVATAEATAAEFKKQSHYLSQYLGEVRRQVDEDLLTSMDELRGRRNASSAAPFVWRRNDEEPLEFAQAVVLHLGQQIEKNRGMVSDLSDQLASHRPMLDQIEQMETMNAQMEKANSELQDVADSCAARARSLSAMVEVLELNVSTAVEQQARCQGHLEKIIADAAASHHEFCEKYVSVKTPPPDAPPPQKAAAAAAATPLDERPFSRYFQPREKPLDDASILLQLANECLTHSGDDSLPPSEKCAALQRYYVGGVDHSALEGLLLNR